MKLPFGYLPGHWGIKGKSREIAKAEYELSGFELKKELLRLNVDMFTPVQYQTKTFDLLLEFGKIDTAEYQRLVVSLIENKDQKELALLELDFKEGKLTDHEYQKKTATLKGLPFITVLSMDFNGAKSLEGSFELDWNELFVEDLQAKGYIGGTPDNIVNQWFMEVCRNVALEEFDGTGDFTADSAANLDAVRRWNSSESLADGRKGFK